MKRVMLRLIPLLIVSYIVSYLDRVNIGFASLTMNRDLGLSSAVYGLGAGLFFVTYFLFEVPSNIMLHRVGARWWLARIMLTWGVLSGATGFIPQIAAATGLSHETVFYVIRLLLGAAEAGFFPGVIFYLTLWFPGTYRARVIGYFMTALPAASVLGGPLCGWLLGLNGVKGMAGWQWLFVIEALPALILAVVLLVFLTDRPENAAWLEKDQRDWLTKEIAAQEATARAVPKQSTLKVLTHPLVIGLGMVYFSVVYMNYTIGFFLPSIIKEFGLTNLQTGLVAALPSAVGTASMVLWGRRSDKRNERKWHLVFALAVGALSFGAASLAHTPVLTVICFSIAAFGIYGSQPVFWTLPGVFLTGGSAAAGIAAINAIANLSGFIGPYLMGYLKTATGTYSTGLFVASVMAGIATILVASFSRRRFSAQPANHPVTASH